LAASPFPEPAIALLTCPTPLPPLPIRAPFPPPLPARPSAALPIPPLPALRLNVAATPAGPSTLHRHKRSARQGLPALVGIDQTGFGTELGNRRLIDKVFEGLLERQDPCVCGFFGCGSLFDRGRLGPLLRRLLLGLCRLRFLRILLFLFLPLGFLDRLRLVLLPDHHRQPFRDLDNGWTDRLRHGHQADDDGEEQAEEQRGPQGAAVAPVALVIRAPGHDRRVMRNRGKLPIDGEFFIAPLVAGMRIVYFIVQAVEFIEAPVRLCLETRLFFQDPADFPVEAGDVAPQPCDAPGGILDLRQFSPEELTGFQFVESVEEIAGVPQGVETEPVGGKGFKLCVYRTHLALELRQRSPGLFDLRVKRRQFLL
jgi:hypothetical protein